MANKSLISRILNSIFFKRANVGAVRYARNSRSLYNLIREALDKSGGLSGANIAAFREQLNIVTRLLRAYASGEYRQIPWKTLIRMIAVLIYFVSPIDILPDFLPIVGLSDDIALMLWLFSGIKDDIEKFRQWEGSAATMAEDVPHRVKTIKIG
ncbi:YkvA family protein [Spirosoma sp. SC4-14]|uniref:YkvA family protein n=1 Tax=Spirosoma sp. SC4-14 TaxID=3128900 RepID=UPI0030D176F0